VVTAEPVATVTLNVEASPLVNVITLFTADAVVSNDAVDTVVPAFKANEAVVANEDDIACEEVIAKLPVIVFPSPSCSSLPLICVMNWYDWLMNKLDKLRPILYVKN
jgi:hypothetical protein